MNTQTKKNILITSISFVCLFSFLYWVYGVFFISTDDAYVNANVVQIAPRVTGAIADLHVKNNQFVTAGENLFDLDPQPFQISLAQAQAQVEMNNAALKLAQVTANRTIKLEKNKYASLQENDSAQSNLESANATVKLAQANLMQAQLNLHYTEIAAPANGWVTNVSLRVGDIANANQPLFELISDDEFWIDANFKETDIHRIHLGQKTKISVDMYPHHTFLGIVESISGGSGSAFSLLPPENATGNWVKVTQRVPVRIRIINPDISHYPLRIGTTATVTIHT